MLNIFTGSESFVLNYEIRESLFTFVILSFLSLKLFT